MTEHKYTDEEVIKALECCRDFGDCSLCPYDGAVFDDEPYCVEKLHTYALDLINRQKAEIAFWMDAAANAKKEAVKGFAEKLKQEAGYFGRAVAVETIKDLVKEFTEE